MEHTFRIVLYAGATATCDRLALLAARSNGAAPDHMTFPEMSYKKFETIFKRSLPEDGSTAHIGREGFQIIKDGAVLLLIQQAEIL